MDKNLYHAIVFLRKNKFDIKVKNNIIKKNKFTHDTLDYKIKQQLGTFIFFIKETCKYWISEACF